MDDLKIFNSTYLNKSKAEENFKKKKSDTKFFLI